MASIIDSKLIFSDQLTYRLRRHLLFWFCMWAYIALTHAANPLGKEEIAYFRNPVYTLSEAVLIVVAQFPVVYIMLYFILPKFILKKKYITAFFAILLLWFCGGIMNLYLFRDVQPAILSVIVPGQFLVNTQRSEAVSFFMAVMFQSKGVLLFSSIAFVIKFAKYWYLKEKRNMQLQKENTESQIRLLTAQVHPHFLFNTLNNIYSQTQKESPKGSKMIMGLSDLLRYILYEGQKPLVPLKQELLMITEYINLEKIRYGNKLDVHVLTPDKTDDIFIAPLLLLPFIENCFKHGACNMLENPWINLTVELKDTTLLMKLMNGKARVSENGHSKTGIGISNVRRRLELLYKEKFDLQIREDEEVFVVDLHVELTKFKNKEQVNILVQTESAIAYA